MHICIYIYRLVPIAQKLLNNGLKTNVLQTVSEHFYKWKENYNIQIKFHNNCIKYNNNSLLLVHNGTRHSNFSDLAIWNPRTTRWTNMIGKIDEKLAFNQINIVQALYLKDKLNNQLDDSDSKKSINSYVKTQDNLKLIH